MPFVQDALTKDLYQSRSGLLVLHWGGHGALGDADSMHLFCADAIEADKRNIDLANLMSALHTTIYPHHRRQLIFVDACQTAVSERRWQNTVPRFTYSHGQFDAFHDQSAFFAASRGERAVNENRLRGGLFSRVLLETLDESQRDVWPPDVDELRGSLSERFNQLREARQTRQVPSYVRYQGRSDKDTIFTLHPAPGHTNPRSVGCQFLTQREFGRLKRILDGGPAPENLRACYLLEAAPLIEPPRHPDDLMSCVDVFRRAVDRMHLMRFLVRLAAGSEDPGTRQGLWEWIEEMADVYDMDIDGLRDLDQELHRTVLLVQVKPDLIEDGDQVTVWTYVAGDGRQAIASDVPWNRDRLAEELSRLLSGNDPRLAAGAASVEFQVQTSLLNEDFEGLVIHTEDRDQKLGSLLPVVVRPLDRLGNRAHCDRWRDKWARLTAHWEAYDPQAIGWPDQPPRAEHVCAPLTDDRPGLAGPDVTLEAVLAAGMPSALWHRENRPDPRKALGSVLRNRALQSLPEVVMSQRNGSEAPAALPDHAGRGLVLMWDDPTRVPENIQWESPTPQGAAS